MFSVLRRQVPEHACGMVEICMVAGMAEFKTKQEQVSQVIRYTPKLPTRPRKQ